LLGEYDDSGAPSPRRIILDDYDDDDDDDDDDHDEFEAQNCADQQEAEERARFEAEERARFEAEERAAQAEDREAYIRAYEREPDAGSATAETQGVATHATTTSAVSEPELGPIWHSAPTVLSTGQTGPDGQTGPGRQTGTSLPTRMFQWFASWV
jgi:hypothetical protein